MQLTYPAKLTGDRKDGGFVVTFRDVPEAITQGDTLADALSEAEGALQAALEVRIDLLREQPAEFAVDARSAHILRLQHGRTRHDTFAAVQPPYLYCLGIFASLITCAQRAISARMN